MTSLDTPEFAQPEHLIPVADYPAHMEAIPPSRMFELKKALDNYLAKHGKDAAVYDASQGDGGASLPGVPRDLLERAFELQVKQGTGYNQPFGTPLFRKTSFEQYWGIQPASGWTPENIIFAQGGRDGLNKAYNAMISLGYGRVGDLLVVSRVPWISYNWGPYGIGLNVLHAPGQPADGWKYTPESIIATAQFAERHNRKVAGLIITSPDNPTGLTMPLEEQIELARAALANGYPFVLFDWMYHWVTDGGHNDINVVLQAFEPEQRERLMFIDGITKSLGASNIRSAQLLAGSKVIKHINSQASHGVVPSFYAQAVAIAAYEKGFGEAAAPIIEPTRQSRKVLRAALEKSGAPFIMGDGYYAFIDVTRYLDNSAFNDSADLGAWLGENYGVTIVPGAYFSDAGKNWVRFSYALPPEITQKAIDRLFEGLNSLL
ncbi:MAG TPA: pyridoxal phosphate-dependent aminotransferase [Aggregatilineales bacterium]|jgi:aspartate/methionine/tyrosine aminotransferase|nr:pyridoxal phosphate-dependent aminotransferase [Aggregatilineales bacterium]